MKKIILMMATILCIIASDTGVSNAGIITGRVPDAVLKSFSQQYPDMTAHHWEVINDTCIASFEMARRRAWAFYLTNGSWIKTETNIPWSRDLPYAVRASWNYSPFASWYIDKMMAIEMPGKNAYAIRVHKDTGPDGAIPGDWEDVYVLYFDQNGAMYKKEQIE